MGWEHPDRAVSCNCSKVHVACKNGCAVLGRGLCVDTPGSPSAGRDAICPAYRRVSAALLHTAVSRDRK
eukprot:364076-Chlamydomonas_euryale.AAC.11